MIAKYFLSRYFSMMMSIVSESLKLLLPHPTLQNTMFNLLWAPADHSEVTELEAQGLGAHSLTTPWSGVISSCAEFHSSV